ncbi:GNAT family N-acetyltransferase [Pseudomonas sp. dw_358]|uniref:GNAT family N-acetyltransferase n=1 Tax=Pseudomonas sp. dw_358 TaxID=2720083 RepID=UPI001BD6959B|nr:GNAT family N-acetyltransferase [Pseudomonas sp. dw_358]
MNNLTLRNALVTDAAVLCEAERETARTPGLLISRASELSRESFADKIDALSRTGLYMVAERNGLVVGHALLEPFGLEALAHVSSLTVVVHPGNLGQGVGHALMTALLEWARAQPALLKIELRVRETNSRARRLYATFGFVEEGRLQKRILLPDGTFVADVHMAWFASD